MHCSTQEESRIHTNKRRHARKHRYTKEARKSNSQNLQVTQGSKGSIFNAADLIVVQLPAGRKGKYEGLPGNHAVWEHHVLSSPVTKVSLHPLAVFACHQEKARL